MAGGSLLLREYPAETVRLSCEKRGRAGQYRKQNLIERYGTDIRLPDLREEISQCSRPWETAGGFAMLTVNLGVLMDDQSAQINPLIANLQKNNIDLIEFAKRRQWAITNYSVLIYSAIFALAHSFDKTIRTGEKTGGEPYWPSSLGDARSDC